MRQFEDVERRWSLLFNTSIGVDLRQALRDDKSFDPCEEGLRSICWRAYLLYGPLSQASWSKKLSESRGAYSSLRDHFLRYVNNPNDVHSTVDPLADVENSPWSSLRQDELIREEIFQDVTRCMQDNYFFREPTTQRKLLDILFVYTKLNPDTGYRQGMHELLAPILWVISQDVVDTTRVSDFAKKEEGVSFMLQVLDKKYVEHDAFSLFCAVMQTAKGFYEVGENKESSTIVTQSNRIHDELLASVDPDLAHHLRVVGVLPQIYSIRWVRLLFGREFEFKEVLKVWDLLFAESLTVEIVELTCVAMLLRAHWELIDASYTSAITKVTRLELSITNGGARSLVKDAIYLSRHKTAEGGAAVIQLRTDRRPRVSAPVGDDDVVHPSPSTPKPVPKRWSQIQQSPSNSPNRFNTPQKQLESLFQEVSGTLQRRTEGWSKTVRGAVGEVKRNMNNLQSSHSRTMSSDKMHQPIHDMCQNLQDRVRTLEKRNKALSRMLDEALESLRSSKPDNSSVRESTEDVFNMALARIQFVAVYLADSDINIPSEEHEQDDILGREAQAEPTNGQATTHNETVSPAIAIHEEELSQDQDTAQKEIDAKSPKGVHRSKPEDHGDIHNTQTLSTALPKVRPSLADSSFSFMLGEDRRRSSFVSSVSDLPEQRRGSGSTARPKQLWAETKDTVKADRKEIKSGSDDGFTMNPLK